MENSNDILNELNDLSPVIAAMEKVNVFTVPEGYFQSLELDIMLAVKEDSGLLNNIDTPVLNDVPQGYFESLAGNILNKIKALDETNEELKELSPVLHNLPQQNVFSVPQGYFESFSANVLSKINTIENADEELNILSPMLAAVKNKNVFTVPEGYFEEMPAMILNAVTPQQARVVSMGKRTAATFIKYAVAAVFTGAMAMGVYKFIAPPVVTAEDPTVAVGKQIAKENKFDEELSKVTDDDIIKYLQANGENVDAQAVVTNMVNENELPTQEDYLTDDKALDKYLDNIDLNDFKN
jgi:hypothetical protein